MSIRVVLLSFDHLPRAAQLVAEGYRQLRQQIPLVPTQQEDFNTILPKLQELLASASGVAAWDGEQMVGFLAGMILPQRSGVRRVYCPEYAHAPVTAGKQEIYRKMYQALAELWVANGCYSHAVTCLAPDDDAVQAWYRTGFGLIVIDALRDLSPLEVSAPAGVEVKLIGRDQINQLVPLVEDHQRYMATSPIFMPLVHFDTYHELEQQFDDPTFRVWLATYQGEPIAYIQCVRSYTGAQYTPIDPLTMSINGAYTKPEFRGQNVASLLLKQVLDYARAGGYQRCAVDFESHNIAGSRFWLRHFTPICYSLSRRIDERIGWARADRVREQAY